MKHAIALAALALSCAACSSDDKTAATTTETFFVAESAPTSTAAPGVCTPLGDVSELNAEVDALITTASPYPALRDLLVEVQPRLVSAYSRAAGLAPDLAGDLALLADRAEAIAVAAKDVKSLPELNGRILALPDAVTADEAGKRLDAYARQECGFSTFAG